MGTACCPRRGWIQSRAAVGADRLDPLALDGLRFLRNPVRNFKELSPAKKFLFAAWTVIGALYATVMHFTTGAAWGYCVAIAAVMAAFSGAVAAVMCGHQAGIV